MDDIIASAARTFETEARALTALREAVEGPLAPAMVQAVQAIHGAGGRVILSGIGKSGHVARKIAATFASTGTPSYFVHPAEASHGDLGMIRADDVILALSWSGEAPELADLIAYSRRFGVTLIALTSRADSALGQAADIVLLLPRMPEACPNGLAPTTSTVMQMAMGDALAVALLTLRGFTAQDFRQFHPGGKLGARLLRVRDLMHRTPPLVSGETPMSDTLLTMTRAGFGVVGVTDAEGHLQGIVTDGDLRRHMQDLLSMTAGQVMTPHPRTTRPEALAVEALAMMNDRKITCLLVTGDGTDAVGILHIHDCLRAGVA